MILNNHTGVQGLYRYSENCEYEKGDFVVYGNCIYICTATKPTNTENNTVKGISPDESPENFSMYPGDKITSKEEYYEFLEGSSNKSLQDKYISAEVLSEILSDSYFGLGNNGIVSDFISYSSESGEVSFTIKGESGSFNAITKDRKVLDSMLVDSRLNNGSVRVSANLPEIESIAPKIITDNNNILITGKVTNQSGNPIENCLVMEFTPSSSTYRNSKSTNSKGEYRITVSDESSRLVFKDSTGKYFDSAAYHLVGDCDSSNTIDVIMLDDTVKAVSGKVMALDGSTLTGVSVKAIKNNLPFVFVEYNDGISFENENDYIQNKISVRAPYSEFSYEAIRELLYTDTRRKYGRIYFLDITTAKSFYNSITGSSKPSYIKSATLSETTQDTPSSGGGTVTKYNYYYRVLNESSNPITSGKWELKNGSSVIAQGTLSNDGYIKATNLTQSSLYLTITPESGYTINTTKCNLCGDCENACPTSSIDLSNYSIDSETCIACDRCVETCPLSAITSNANYNPYNNTVNGSKTLGAAVNITLEKKTSSTLPGNNTYYYDLVFKRGIDLITNTETYITVHGGGNALGTYAIGYGGVAGHIKLTLKVSSIVLQIQSEAFELEDPDASYNGSSSNNSKSTVVYLENKESDNNDYGGDNGGIDRYPNMYLADTSSSTTDDGIEEATEEVGTGNNPSQVEEVVDPIEETGNNQEVVEPGDDTEGEVEENPGEVVDPIEETEDNREEVVEPGDDTGGEIEEENPEEVVEDEEEVEEIPEEFEEYVPEITDEQLSSGTSYSVSDYDGILWLLVSADNCISRVIPVNGRSNIDIVLRPICNTINIQLVDAYSKDGITDFSDVSNISVKLISTSVPMEVLSSTYSGDSVNMHTVVLTNPEVITVDNRQNLKYSADISGLNAKKRYLYLIVKCNNNLENVIGTYSVQLPDLNGDVKIPIRKDFSGDSYKNVLVKVYNEDKSLVEKIVGASLISTKFPGECTSATDLSSGEILINNNNILGNSNKYFRWDSKYDAILINSDNNTNCVPTIVPINYRDSMGIVVLPISKSKRYYASAAPRDIQTLIVRQYTYLDEVENSNGYVRVQEIIDPYYSNIYYRYAISKNSKEINFSSIKTLVSSWKKLNNNTEEEIAKQLDGIQSYYQERIKQLEKKEASLESLYRIKRLSPTFNGTNEATIQLGDVSTSGSLVMTVLLKVSLSVPGLYKTATVTFDAFDSIRESTGVCKYIFGTDSTKTSESLSVSYVGGNIVITAPSGYEIKEINCKQKYQ